MLPVQVSPNFLEKIFESIAADPQTLLIVDLEAQTITLEAQQLQESFEIDAYKKVCLLNGYDDIDYLLSIQDKIQDFEKHYVPSF